jgi:hypothetical protein
VHIVEEITNDAPNSLDAFCGERRAVGFYMGEFGGLAKNNFMMHVRRELALGGHGMLVPGADIVDTAWHGEATQVFGMIWAVVSFECHTCKAGAINFFRDFVVFLESLAKMIQVRITYVLSGKVVNDECKHGGAPLVPPETRGGGCLVVVEFGKAVSEEVVSKDACLGETVHATAHFEVDPGVTGKLVVLVLVNEFLGMSASLMRMYSDSGRSRGVLR